MVRYFCQRKYEIGSLVYDILYWAAIYIYNIGIFTCLRFMSYLAGDEYLTGRDETYWDNVWSCALSQTHCGELHMQLEDDVTDVLSLSITDDVPAEHSMYNA